MKAPEERWRDIAGYDGKYQVSTEGRVRSMTFGQYRRKTPKILKPDFDRAAHKARIVLGGKDTRSIPRLVYEAFVGPVPEGMIVYQRDGNLENTALHNLAIASRAERFRERAKKIGGPNHRPVLKISTTLEVVTAYRSAREAARLNGFPDKSYVTRQCNLQVKSSVLSPDGFIYIWDDPMWIRRMLNRAIREFDAQGIRYNDPHTVRYYDLEPLLDFDIDPGLWWGEATALTAGGGSFRQLQYLIGA